MNFNYFSAGLLGIEPLPNNGTTGSLHHLLTPSLLPSFPPPQALPGTPGITGSCPYPLDEDGMYSRRSFCEECVCRRMEECADVSNATIDDSNLRLNLITDESKFHRKKINFDERMLYIICTGIVFQLLIFKCYTCRGGSPVEGRGLAPVC